MDLNLLIIILYIFKNFKLSSLRNKSNYNNFKNNFCDNSEYIFDININEKSCKDLNYSKFVCEIFDIERDFLDNYNCNYSYITEIKMTSKDKYSNLVFFNNFFNYYRNIFLYMKLNLPIFVRNFNEFLKILYFYIHNINNILNTNFFQLNYKINMNIIRRICDKEKQNFIIEINVETINILLLYILNSILFLYLYIKNKHRNKNTNKNMNFDQEKNKKNE